jgi:hypothetical protein
MCPVATDAFLHGDVYIDFPFERAKFRYDKASGKVYLRFYGEAQEDEVPWSSELFHEARRGGREITRDEYYRD